MADRAASSRSGNLDPLRVRLRDAGQEHLLAHLERLPAREAARLAAELEALDLDLVARLVAQLRAGEPAGVPTDLAPPEAVSLAEREKGGARLDAARRRGEALLRAGKVACLTVAGGQATRLKWSGPKGCLEVGPVSNRTLFAIHAHKVAGTIRRYGARVPWFVLTSPTNHEATIEAFRAARFFGLQPDDVRFFTQGTAPAVDLEGRLLLAPEGTLLRSPDGHGGVFAALRAGGILDESRARGIEHLSYFQVDNPLIPAADPLFLGLHEEGKADMSAKFVAKRAPSEKVGVLVRTGASVACVEYSDLDPELAEARDASGDLRFAAGNIAAHAIRVSFAEACAEADLPFHRAEKTLKTLGAEGAAVETRGVKFERFVFDALPRARAVICLEVAREEEFSPVKNAEGENSPDTARRAIAAQAARWFRRAGLPLPPPLPEGEPAAEVSGRFALDADEFVERAGEVRVDPGNPVYVE